jgi:hypothetical protein
MIHYPIDRPFRILYVSIVSHDNSHYLDSAHEDHGKGEMHKGDKAFMTKNLTEAMSFALPIRCSNRSAMPEPRDIARAFVC